MKARARSGVITARPSGFLRSEAILARNLLKETPADAVSPVVLRISALIAFAIATAGIGPPVGSVTSR